MTYLLDTNVCIVLINGTSERVRSHFESALDQKATVCISTISVFELWYGVAKSSRPDQNARQVRAFLAAPLEITSFDEEDGSTAGTIRAALERVGKPIGAYDLLIAGQASRRGWTLVTSNVSEFARIKGLAWQDWERA